MNLKQVLTVDLCQELFNRGGRMGKMDLNQFLFTLGTTPVISVELAITKTQGQKTGIFLIWRNDENFQGWHFPGSLINQFEFFSECCQRIAKKEAGVTLSNAHVVGIRNFNNPESDKRIWKDKKIQTHFVNPVIMADLEPPSQKSTAGKFFINMPKNMLESHIKVWEICQEYLKGNHTPVIVKEG